MKEALGITPRDLKETIIDMAYSLIEAGLVKKSKKFRVNSLEQIIPTLFINRNQNSYTNTLNAVLVQCSHQLCL